MRLFLIRNEKFRIFRGNFPNPEVANPFDQGQWLVIESCTASTINEKKIKLKESSIFIFAFILFFLLQQKPSWNCFQFLSISISDKSTREPENRNWKAKLTFQSKGQVYFFECRRPFLKSCLKKGQKKRALNPRKVVGGLLISDKAKAGFKKSF